MNKKYSDIINYMRKGKRFNVSKVARALNLPVSTVSDRVRKIEEDYTIKRVSLLNYQKLGYLANAKLAVKASMETKESFLDFIKSERCVNSIYHINSGYDFLIDVVFRDASKMKDWIDTAKSMFGVDIIKFTVLKTEVKEGFVL